MRDIKNDLQIPFGIAAPNPISSTDFYYGTFDTIDDAYANVPATLREVGRQFAVYKSGNKTNRQDGEVIVYTWALAAGQWKHVRVSGEPLPAGTNGQIYEIDNDSPQKVKPTDRLYNVEKKATDNTEAIKHKLDKPTVTGNTTNYPFVVGVNDNNQPAKLPAGDLGKNIANSNLTTIAGSGLTQATPYTWNAANYPLMIKGLPDKTADAAFNRVKVQNPDGTEAFVSKSSILVSGMQEATDAQKDAYRAASLKTGETYSKGQPRVAIILPVFVSNAVNYEQSISFIGENLFLNNTSNVASVKIKRIKDEFKNDVIDDPIDIPNITVSQFAPSIVNAIFSFKDLPKGDYISIITHNGLTNIDRTGFTITDNTNINPTTIDNKGWVLEDGTSDFAAAGFNVIDPLNLKAIGDLNGIAKGTLKIITQDPILTPTELTQDFFFDINAPLVFPQSAGSYWGSVPFTMGICDHKGLSIIEIRRNSVAWMDNGMFINNIKISTNASQEYSTFKIVKIGSFIKIISISNSAVWVSDINMFSINTNWHFYVKTNANNHYLNGNVSLSIKNIIT